LGPDPHGPAWARMGRMGPHGPIYRPEGPLPWPALAPHIHTSALTLPGISIRQTPAISNVVWKGKVRSDRCPQARCRLPVQIPQTTDTQVT
jgi:hypothetical protein